MSRAYRYIRRQCWRKDGRPKTQLTEKAAKARVNPQGGEQAYQCEVCTAWHIGHKPGATSLRQQRREAYQVSTLPITGRPE